ncbi:MAG TPA: TIGR04282 family arsenosugar biosynthesis glycosyltransferase [Ktedonobacterales bacterium]|nr:TIGR04282 family arsenosugar biosynthesis glycosyltransferase [Ktedonobacterales bacterium]
MKASNHARRDALVIVAKHPTPGQVKTRLGATIGLDRSAGLYAAFLRDLRARFTVAAATSGYDLIWACAASDTPMTALLGADATILQQRGNDFAERLYNSCRDVATLAYRRTVILGSDSPHVPAETITQAFHALAGFDVVLGPAEDGGYYLVGVNNWPEPPNLIRGIEMSTERVLRETLARVGRLGLTHTLLDATFDVDTEADLSRLAHALDTAPCLAPVTQAVLHAILAERALTDRGRR